MRIIGGRDYYDGVMSYGQDDIIYVRQRNTDIDSVKAANLPLEYPVDCRFLRHSVERLTKGLIAIPILVWFAGVRYGAIKLEEKYRGDNPYSKLFWNRDDFFEALENNTVEDRTIIPVMKNRVLRQTVDAIFNHKGRESDKKWMIENGVAIAIGVANSTPNI